MANNPNTGKIMNGVIVAGDDSDPDPKKLGRVKVLVPSIHGEGYSVKDLPWSQVMAQSGNQGAFSFNRPPPTGSQVKVRMLNESGHVEVMSIVHQTPSGSNYPTSWQNKALSTKYAENAKGDAITKDKSKDNSERNGKEGAELDKVQDKDAPSVKDTNPTHPTSRIVRKYKPITNVSTGRSADVESLSNEMASALNNLTNFNLSDLMSMLTPKMQAELKKTMPSEVYSALESTLNTLGSHTPKSAANFSASSGSVNPASFPTNAMNVLLNVKSIDDLDNALKRLTDDSSIGDLANVVIDVVTSNTGFANLVQTILPTGEIQTDLTKYLSGIESAAATVRTATTGDPINFLQESSIPTDLLKRIPKELQGELSSVMNEFATTLKEINLQAKNWTGD